MVSTLKWKLIAVVVAGVGAIYLLLPTLLHTTEQRAALEAAGKPLPWYLYLLPDNVLTLGLDLQGGIYVELDVAQEEAIRHKTDILGEEIRREVEGNAGQVTTVTQPKAGTLDIDLPTEGDWQKFDDIHSRYYRRVFAIRGVTADGVVRRAHLVMTADYRKQLAANVVEQATDSVRNRINRFGVGEPDIRRQGESRIAIELPGLRDPDRALELIKRTGQLELRLIPEVNTPSAFDAQQADLHVKVAQVRADQHIADDDWRLETTQQINTLLQGQIPEGTEVLFGLVRNPQTQAIVRGIPYLVEDKARVTGDMLTNAHVTVDRNDPQVAFTLNKTGTKIFADLTTKHVKEFFAIVLDGTVMSAPQIREPILQGSGVITLGGGNFDTKQSEAHDLALILQEGALPATLTEATKTVVGPSLGKDLIDEGFRASWIAALGVVLFILIYYKVAGLIADLALLLNVILLLAVLALFDATLTLPGIAGIVLTMGMAVDANVIINERIREELRAGKLVPQAIHEGYANAKRAVLDSNITTLIAGIVLYQFGTGPIKGFAVTLCVGIITTLFTAVIATEAGFEWCFVRRRVEKLSI